MYGEGEHTAVKVITYRADTIDLRIAVDGIRELRILEQHVPDLFAYRAAFFKSGSDGLRSVGYRILSNDETILQGIV